MSLITVANLQSVTDHLGAIYETMLGTVGSFDDQDAPVTGTLQKLAKASRDLVVALGDYEQHKDLEDSINSAVYGTTNAQGFLSGYADFLSFLNDHCSKRGASVSDTIVSLATYLEYYNAGGNIFTAMLTPGFAKLWNAIMASSLPIAGLMSPAIHPVWNSAVSSNGMGAMTVGGAFAAGTAVDGSLYSAVTPLLEVITDFANGTAPPDVTVEGVDHTGVGTTTWSATLTGNNPDSSVSTTITPAVNQDSRQTVAVGSLTNILAGSVLTVAGSAPDKEVIIVEAASGGNITAVFRKAHSAGAALTGNDTYALTPSVAGRRLVSVADITIDVTGHDAGVVRVVGKQDRGAI